MLERNLADRASDGMREARGPVSNRLRRNIRILLLEDSPSDSLLVRAQLSRDELPDVEIVEADRLSEALRQIVARPFDLALIDLYLPDSAGLATVDRLREAAPGLPLIVLSGASDERLAVEALRRGVQDYLVKGQLPAHGLARTIQNAIERQAFAAALAASKSRIRSVIEASSDAMVIVDHLGTVQFVNPAAEQMFGRGAGALIGRPFGIPIGGGQAREIDILRPNGAEGIAEMRVVGTQWDGNEALLVNLRDITEWKRAEREIAELNASIERKVSERTDELEIANRELESFSYSVSHDLRAPLRAVEGFGKALLEDFGDRLDGPATGYVQRILEASRHMADLIEDMLRLAQVAKHALDIRPVDLSTIAREVAAGLRERNPARQVDLQLAQTAPAKADLRLMRIVMENLLGNAWKYTSKTAAPRIEFGSAVEPDGWISFFVRDNGAGFDDEHAGKLFGLFQRLHSDAEFEGTGVGLAIVQRIISRHGGRVSATGRPGEGATIAFSLPPHSKERSDAQ